MGVYGLAGSPITGSPPACRVYHNTTQSISNGVVTPLAFNSERYDTDTMHDTVTNNTRITINTAGLYLITGNIVFVTDTDYLRRAVLINLGATTIAQQETSTPSNANEFLSIATVYKCAVNDILTLNVFQTNTSANANNVSAVSNLSPEFTATWLGLGT